MTNEQRVEEFYSKLKHLCEQYKINLLGTAGVGKDKDVVQMFSVEIYWKQEIKVGELKQMHKNLISLATLGEVKLQEVTSEKEKN